ncbi:MAG: toll/interleukin-1 receptor domain-containing protein [Terracidiphilus sp.]
MLITPEGFTVNIKPGKLVFISYAREDLDTATEIKDAIDRTGLNGWLDVRYLRGGLPWKSQIARMIQKSDFFVAVLSKLSVEKRGYVQREIREALETALSIPESRTFIVPVRLDECEPKHPALLNLSWIDLFPDRKVGIRRLIQSLHAPLDEQ